MALTIFRFYVFSVLVGLFSVAASAQPLAPPPQLGGGGEVERQHVPHLSNQQRIEIVRQLQLSQQSLALQGVIGSADMEAQPSFIWPVRKAIGVDSFNVDAVSNFVDHDPANPGALLDYNCGSRSYDLPGYNHRGLDIFTWPFSWHQMNNDEAEIVAAAAGTIILKSDGNPDTSCAIAGGNWNAVYVRHADDSVAWYGHMKNNSLTSKAVGDSVAQGEYLGVVGSSGNSTGPHLHIEIYDSQGALIDPYSGTCNSLNADSWWLNQPAYYESQINQLGTGQSAVQFNPCPNTATTNFTNTFEPSDPLYVTAFYRDQLPSTPTTYSIKRPDGSNYSTWSHTGPRAYSASWWYWGYGSFPGTPTGAWSWNADFLSENYSKEFYIVDNCANNRIVPPQFLAGVMTYGATNSISTANNNVRVESDGTLNLFAASAVTLGNSFSVANGGTVVAKNVAVCG